MTRIAVMSSIRVEQNFCLWAIYSHVRQCIMCVLESQFSLIANLWKTKLLSSHFRGVDLKQWKYFNIAASEYKSERMHEFLCSLHRQVNCSQLMVCLCGHYHCSRNIKLWKRAFHCAHGKWHTHKQFTKCFLKTLLKYGCKWISDLKSEQMHGSFLCCLSWQVFCRQLMVCLCDHCHCSKNMMLKRHVFQ